MTMDLNRVSIDHAAPLEGARGSRGVRVNARTLALLLLLVPSAAEAQFPFPWRRRKPEPPPVQVQPLLPMPPAQQAPPAPAPEQPAPAAIQPAPQAVQPQGLTPLQQEDRARLLKLAREASLTPAASVRDAEDRMERWKMVMLIDPGDVEARLGYEQAQKGLDAARAKEETDRTSKEARDRELAEKRDRLRMAERALYAHDLTGAEGILNVVLRQHPDDPRASSLMDVLRDTRRASELRRRLIYGSVGLLGLAVVLGAWARRVYRTREQEAQGSGDQARALVKVIDGVGRGKLVPVTRGLLRIGAVEGAGDEDRNDLVVSDAHAAVSRFHCAIVRKGRDYFLLDSSLNGTRLNDRRLARGEHHVLRDGDEFVLAESARIKFLRT
jgi:hypothetical protein